MKFYKNTMSLINHLKIIKDQPIDCLRGIDKLTEDQKFALVEITAFISNIFGDELKEFN
jgi:hypothetical protein